MFVMHIIYSNLCFMYMPTTLSFVLVVVDAVRNFTIIHFCIVSQPLFLPMFKMLSIPVGTGNIYQFDIQLGCIPILLVSIVISPGKLTLPDLPEGKKTGIRW